MLLFPLPFSVPGNEASKAPDEKLKINKLGPYAKGFPGANGLMFPPKDAEANLLGGWLFYALGGA